MGRWVAAGVALLSWLIVPAGASGQQEPQEVAVGNGLEGTRPSSSFQDDENGWGIVEHPWVVAPVAAVQPADVLVGNLPKREAPVWPSESMLRKWDFGDSFAYPRLTPDVGVDLRTIVGDVRDDDTVFISRLRAELYLLELGVNTIESVDGDRRGNVDGDVDLRLPLSLGPSFRLALLPGFSVPIDSRPWNSRTTNARMQLIAGYGSAGVGLQLRVGITDGARARGILDPGERIDQTAALYGGLVAWRPIPYLQLRVEAAGEVATEDGAPDRLSLLPGVVIFPLGDPRLQLGLTAVIEDSSENLNFDDVSWGGLMNVGVYFF